MRILVTGGTGYIGAHTVVELITAGHEVSVVDNLANSSSDVLDSIEQVAGTKPHFREASIQDTETISCILHDEDIEAIIHFAAFKAVGESVVHPLKYYENNVNGFLSLLQTACAAGVSNVVFSSTAAVYGNPPQSAATEETICNPENPYGWSKRMDEIILRDLCTADHSFKGTALRYFNVVGAHPSGLLGESPKTKPQNILPIIVQATAGQLPPLTVFGTDYPTPDGTCLRDYIHVVDLAKAHVAALDHREGHKPGYEVFNVGTGSPTSVLELIKTFEDVNGVSVPYTLGARRAGDPINYYAVCDRAQRILHWQAEKTIEDAVGDAWRWHQHLTSMVQQA